MKIQQLRYNLEALKLVGKNCSDCAACDGCGSDVIGAEGTNVHNLWLDHLDISDGSDGNLDFSGAADMVTVSWCKFWYSNPAKGHRLSNLFSGSDTSFSDRGHLRITYSHCWWAANVDQRMPRGRFGQIHLLNCYWNSSGNSYCVNAGVEAQVRLENGYFSGVSDPHQVDQTSGALEASGNIYVNCSGLQQVRGTVFTPPYPYTLDAASDVPTILQNGVGPGKGPFAP